MISPLGNDVKSSWANLLAGKSGIDKVTRFDVTDFPTKIAGEVKNFEYEPYYDDPYILRKLRHFDIAIQYGSVASNQAIVDAGLKSAGEDVLDKSRVGVCLACGLNGVAKHFKMLKAFHEKKTYKALSPYFIPSFLGSTVSGLVSMEHGYTGPNISLVTACATGNHAIIFGAMNIKMGLADVFIGGGTDAGIEPCTFGGFCRLRAFAKSYNDEPNRASRPYDKDREGFVASEGAGALVLEEYEHAKRRGAHIYGEVAGFGMTSDAYDMVKPHPEGLGAYNSMLDACKSAEVNPHDINYINAHGTSTPQGDKSEAQAVLKLIKGEQKSESLYLNSTKSMTGHMLSAAGAVEALISLLTIQEGKIPPSINIDHLDEEIGLTKDTINTEVIEKDVKVAISNSFGFGGHNASLLMKKI